MEQELTLAHPSLSEGPANGVAPHAGSSDPVPEAPTRPPATFHWLAYHRHGWQFGEQGILDALARELNDHIPLEHRWCVEFGAGDGHELPLACDRVMRGLKWWTLLIEGKQESCESLRLRVPAWTHVVHGAVTLDPGKTIDDYMERAGCPADCGLMVVDIDSFDYYVVASMKARPYILCVEHMDEVCNVHPRAAFVPRLEDCGKMAESTMGQGYFSMQATSQALDLTMTNAEYVLAFRSRVNSVYVRRDVADKLMKEPDGKVRLNLGCGSWNDPRYIPLDIKNGHDIRKLDYPDDSVDEIYASHVLEHFSFKETRDILKEWARVLKPGGLMRVAVPDAKYLAEKILALEGTGEHRSIEMLVYGAHSDDTDKHQAMFTHDSLREEMNQAGIGYVTKFHPFIADDCASDPCSLNLQGTKRHWPKLKDGVVTLVLNQPRFTFTGHEIRLVEAAKKLDFSLQPAGGAFWDRDMTCATKMAIARSDPDFLLYSDYDSIFEVDEVQKLYDTINNDPYMAAIGVVQMSRHNDRPLVFEDHIKYDEPVSRVKFQHFGLMIVRREVFDELPQPWFWSVPGMKDGQWDWDTWSRSDADITFWRHMSMMGFRVYQHNDICIGHIIQAIKYPRKDGKGVMLVPIENYWKHGKPKQVGFNPELYRTKATTIEPDKAVKTDG